MSNFKNPWERGGKLYPDFEGQAEEDLFENNDSVLGKPTINNDTTSALCSFSNLELSWRISSKSKNEFTVYTKTGNVMRYTNSDGAIAGDAVVLPESAKVIKLCPNPENEDHYKVVFFWQDKYRQGYLHKEAFSEQYFTGTTKYSKAIFINDLKRLLKNIDHWKINFNKYQVIGNAYLFIQDFITNNSITETDIELAINQFETDFILPTESDVDTQFEWLNKIVTYLMPVMGALWSEKNVVYLPFAKDFLEQNNIKITNPLYQKYETIINDMNWDTGSVYGDHSLLPYAKDFLTIMYSDIDNFKQSKVVEWLKNLDIDNCGVIIALGQMLFKSDFNAYTKKYYSSVAIDISVGPVSTLPMITTILHESDQLSLEYLPGDSHSSSNADIIFEHLKSKDFESIFESDKFENKFKNEILGIFGADSSFVDIVYQGNTFLSLVNSVAFVKNYLN